MHPFTPHHAGSRTVITSGWRLPPVVAGVVLLFATGSGQAQSQNAPAGERQAISQPTDDALRREAEEKYRMQQIGDKVRFLVRSRVVEGRLMQVSPAGVRVGSVWVVPMDIDEDSQAHVFQAKHDEMVEKYIRRALIARKKAEAQAAAASSSRLVKASDGKLYDLSKVAKQDPDGLTLETVDGLKKIAFEQLPLEVQVAFGYDRKAADAYRAQVVKAKSAQAIRDAELNRIELAKSEKERQLELVREEEERKNELAKLEAERNMKQTKNAIAKNQRGGFTSAPGIDPGIAKAFEKAARHLGIPGGKLMNVSVQPEGGLSPGFVFANQHSSPEMLQQQIQNDRERRMQNLEKKVNGGW
jgi:hypothetical protein